MQEITVKENEHVVLPMLWTGEEKELEYRISLSERGASIRFLGLLLGDESAGLKLKVTVLHKAKETKSEVIIKGAMRDSSQVYFDGLITIAPGAKGANAWLAAHLLLLSSKARGIAVPNLEILENDVKAGHAATVGKLNELELFYLMSRGLNEAVAKNLIMQGFLHSLLAEFPLDLLKKAKNRGVVYEEL